MKKLVFGAAVLLLSGAMALAQQSNSYPSSPSQTANPNQNQPSAAVPQSDNSASQMSSSDRDLQKQAQDALKKDKALQSVDVTVVAPDRSA